MTGFPRSPKLTRAGLVLIEPESGAMTRTIALQYAAETLTRSVKAQAVESEGDRSQPLRLTGPAVETISFDAEMDATDQLEFPDQHRAAVETGLLPALSALECLVQPTVAQLERQNTQRKNGSFSITPAETPLALFVWSRSRVVPVRLSEISITEEFFDPALNPIRAKVSLSLRVLSVDDLGFDHRGGGLFMAYLQGKEALAARATSGQLGDLGLEGVPS
ncbi:carbohydrate porin [Falsiphaeobacter marinintestinus]|uniref:carbohydrate porin n=1 Tax=Falsiphaeobacter marinintestinus TaxID=1492905 RepID=UPI0011B7C5C0|nr:carbohydrate porin [Phaeobacter marinintestinus]